MGNGENDTAMRRCYICKEIKKLELFAKDVSCSQGYKYRCRDCHNNLTRANGTMRQKYPGKYEELYEKQNGKCGICGRDAGRRHFAIDHNHQTGLIRGLLCYRCNVGLGNFKDSVDFLESAIAYLKR